MGRARFRAQSGCAIGIRSSRYHFFRSEIDAGTCVVILGSPVWTACQESTSSQISLTGAFSRPTDGVAGDASAVAAEAPTVSDTMNSLGQEEFLRWAETKELGLDSRYPQSKTLTFLPLRDAYYWQVPRDQEERLYLLVSLLELLGDWQTCFAWRHLGFWPSADYPPAEGGEHEILKILGLPIGTSNVVEFTRPELGTLLLLMFLTLVYGWSVGEDLYVVPDHARQFLMLSHHDKVHVHLASADDLGSWTEVLAERDFGLPQEIGSIRKDR